MQTNTGQIVAKENKPETSAAIALYDSHTEAEAAVIKYEAQIKAGKFAVMAHGSFDEISKAQTTFKASQHQGVQEHACCA